VPTTTPSPASQTGGNIVGLWEGSKNSVNYTMQISGDGTLIYNEDGNMAKGAWVKRGDNQYTIGILNYDTNVTINTTTNQFNWGPKGVNFTKKT
jgi:hypothetical protein